MTPSFGELIEPMKPGYNTRKRDWNRRVRCVGQARLTLDQVAADLGVKRRADPLGAAGERNPLASARHLVNSKPSDRIHDVIFAISPALRPKRSAYCSGVSHLRKFGDHGLCCSSSN
jgi:hypothetical protein